MPGIRSGSTVCLPFWARSSPWLDGGSARFEIDPDVKHRLLNGLDEIGLTLQKDEAISAYERDRERLGPTTTSL